MRFLSSGLALAAASLVLVAVITALPAAHAQTSCLTTARPNNAQAYFSDPSYFDMGFQWHSLFCSGNLYFRGNNDF